MEETITKAIDILYLAKQNEVDVILNGDQLQLKIPKGKVIGKDLLEKLGANKKLIIDFLSNDNWKSTIVSKSNLEISSFNRDVVKRIPLSFSQERLWFIDRLEGSLQYHLPAVLRLKGNLDCKALSQALAEVVNRHEILRSVYMEENDQVYQRVKVAGNWQLRESDGRKYAKKELESYIQALIMEPFDLCKDDTFRADLIRLDSEDHILVVTMHHIASDASSTSVLVGEVAALYSSYVAGEAAPLPLLSLQYADYAVWQRDHVQGSFLEEKLSYWKHQLEDVSPLQLPADYARSAGGSSRGSTLSFEIGGELGRQVQALGHQQGATLYMTLLAAFKVLLYRYSGQEDICVGTSVAGRPQQELEGLIGFFVNTLALRSQVRGDMPFIKLLQDVKGMTREAYEHQEVPFEKVVEAVVKERQAGISPLFQVMLVLDNTPEVPELTLGEIVLSEQDYEQTTTKFDLTFFIKETKGCFKGTIQYNTDLYSEERIARMASHFHELLGSIVSSPEEQVGKLEILSKEELAELQQFGRSESAYPKEATLADLFEAQAQEHPQETAVVFAGEAVSYKELNERANGLAQELQRLGVKAGTLVPLYTPRGIDMLTGILGILKAGGAYVPIDTEFPADRISYMLEDTGAQVAVSSGESTVQLQKLSGGYIEIIGIDSLDKTAVRANPQRSLKAEDLAYVIYTSGSTGKPKGVTVSHGNVADYVYGLDARTGISKCKSYALVSTIATDLGNTVLYSSLLLGGTLHVFTRETVSHIEEIHEYFEEHRIDCLKIVPSHWKALSMDGQPLLPVKLLIFGGEALQSSVADMIRMTETSCRIVNHYGPTETTIGKLLHEVKADKQYGRFIPIGKPFSNTKTCVLSKELSQCPVGIPGQLYISGEGVAKGYLNRPELTAEKFIQNPNGKEGEKMYATGDRVVYQEDGNIIFIGRADDQVKIRGYRVEPGEITRILEQSEHISQAVVLAREDKQGNTQLVGYIVAQGDYDKAGIQAYLKAQLPDYMVPAHLVELQSMPLTANGKIDRKALPDPEGTQQEGGYAAPRNETEAKLAEIWQDILELDQVGINDDFFGIGGHSLLAVRLVSQVRKAFGMELPISDVFDYPTVGQLATRLTGETPGALLPAVTAAARPEHIPLSFSQERLWFIDKLEGSVQYHVPAVLRLEGSLDPQILEKTLQAIINRHEVLRTVILEEEGQGYQHIMETDNWSLGITEKFAGKRETAELSLYIDELIQRPFDLSADYMLRADLIKLEAEEHILVVTMHHIASDGWSKSILVKEVIALYNGYADNAEIALPELEVQYADYAIWQRQFLQGEVLEGKLDYWKQQLEGVATLQLPSDYNRSLVQSSRGSTVSFEISSELSRQLQTLGQYHGATPYMTLLAAFKVLLYRYSGQEDICVGTSSIGRPQPELEGLIGFFMNTLAMRSRVRGDMSFTELLQEVKRTTLEAYAHQEVPFEKVVEAVVKERQVGLSPLFQVLFSLQNTPEVPELKLGALELSEQGYEQTTTKFDLTLLLKETKEGFQGTIQYNTDLYSAERTHRMMAHFRELLVSIVSSPEEQVGSLGMLSQDEKNELLGYSHSESTYPKEATLADLFEAQAQEHPQETAVVFAGEAVSYKELNERANGLAQELQRLGVKAGTLVPLYTPRGIDMLTGILGILKAGGAYVPIDTEFPADRISYMLEDTGAQVAVSSGESTVQLQKLSGGYIEIIGIDSLDKTAVRANPQRSLKAEDLAYVIYTSGSTGKPKGVTVSHGNVADYVYGLDARTGISKCKSYALVSTIATDLGNTVLYSSLLLGGTLHVFTRETVSHIEEIHEYFEEHRIDCLKIVPSHWKALSPEENSPLLPGRMLIFGGEALPCESVERIRNYSTDCRIFNHYGPTETTVGKLVYEVTAGHEGKTVPVGKPFSNTRAYILSKEMSLCPIGVPGQLYIAGQGVARGYLNRPELTAEKFIQNPNGKEGERMYATGDRVVYQKDGNIVFIGRADDQVKIRGYRVEPGEITRILEQSEHVSQAIVLAREDKQGNMQLVGYIVAQGAYDKAGIQAYLKAQLPDYMVPSHLVELQSMPLTANGKIDRKALPDPEGTQQEGDYTAPRNETEAKLAEIWQDILELDQVGINDDFFGIGGHSLLAVRLVSQVRKSFGMELPISDVFDYPTVGQLATRLTGETPGALLPAVTAAARPEYIPLSFSQERLWFIDKLEGSVQYHVPAVLRLEGSLDPQILEKTLQAIINRHEVLRTVIREYDGQGYQYVMSVNNWTLGAIENSAYKEGTKELSEYIAGLITKPFDLSADYMLRADLIKEDEENHILVVTMHHIASDGWSTSILVKEVLALYEGYANNVEANLPELLVQYADYAIWQRQYIQGEILGNKLGYWKSKLQGVSPLQLPTDYNRPLVQSSHGGICNFSIEKNLFAQLVGLSHKHGATLYMTLLSVFNVLLYRYSRQEDICVGSPIIGRSQQELEGLIGFFVNTIALRNCVNEDMSFSKLLGQVKGTTLEAYSHQEVPFEKVVDAVVKERDMSRNPLFQVLFSLQNTPEVPELKLGNLRLMAESRQQATSKFDIAFLIRETNSGITGTIEYSTDLYKEETIERMISHYINLLGSIVSLPETAIGCLAMLSGIEEQMLRIDFNATQAVYPKDKSIIDLFEEQVIKSPKETAIVFENKQLSYEELNKRSNQLARYLQKQGVKAETLVPICVDRGLEMIVGILGIMKAGGVYVPIDPDYPMDRISYMLEDSGASVMLSSSGSREKHGEKETVTIIELDGDWGLIGREAAVNPGVELSPGQLAYMLYTSGSTGRPKGVMMPGGNLVNLLYWQENQFKNKKRRVLQFATFTFDVSFQEIFSTICFGSTLYLINGDRRRDVGELLKDIDKYRITHLFIPFIVLQNLAEVISSLSYNSFFPEEVIVAGEQLKITEDIQELLEKGGTVLINQYGPTEAHVVSSYVIDNSMISPLPPIGKPIWNTNIYIVNGQQGQLSPVGIPGEIYIGGVQVARGYLNRPELTAERFIDDMFSSKPGSRLYKTGDLGRWLPDGNIEYLGRIDDQVKIRGYRIELGEIESVLMQSGLVSQAVVLSRPDINGTNRLIGYVVAEGDYDKQGIVSYLHTRLPEYMIPGLWVELNSFPITQNGKIDKKALPDVDITDLLNNTYVAPRNELEEKLATIWQELLGVERVGINDNFFELGGHSLLAIRVISSVRKELNVELNVRDLFTHPTIASFGAYIELQGKGTLLPPIVANERPSYIPLSFSQERLWFIDRLEGSVQYHLPSVLRLKGSLNQEALKNTLLAVIERHEILRTVIREHDGRGYQHIMPSDKWSLGIVEELSGGEAGLSQYIGCLINKPFDLSADYMLRADLIKLDDQDHVLVVTMHHIASDGWSSSILVSEVIAFYEGCAGNMETVLPALGVQYADYAIWLRKYMQGDILENKLGYWKAKLKDVTTLQMPTDYSHPLVQSSQGTTTSFKINQDLSAQLANLSRQYGATLYMMLLSAFKVLLYRYSGKEDICVGTPVAGRNQQELGGLIGFFINMLALRSRVRGDMPFSELLLEVKNTALEAFAHQEVPFERVVDAVIKERNMSRNPLFGMLFSLQNTPEVPELKFGGLRLSIESQKRTTTQFDIVFTMSETSTGIQGVVQYSTNLYREETIARMINHYINLLGSIVASPEELAGRLDMLSVDEENTLLIDFNNTEAEITYQELDRFNGDENDDSIISF